VPRSRASEPVVLDGSSTAFPLAEAVAHEFMKADKGTAVTVTSSGTGTGFVKFCRGQLDIANASRPITVEEQKACEAANVSFVELPVAHDAITIVVNSANTWASTITVPELRTLWDTTAEKTITTWKQVRAEWPDREITLFGPGTESGTFDYFTDSINGRAGVSRKDYTYVGHGYFERHRQHSRRWPLTTSTTASGAAQSSPAPRTSRVGSIAHSLARCSSTSTRNGSSGLR
jgi:phosphate transport system substrate-binding protein